MLSLTVVLVEPIRLIRSPSPEDEFLFTRTPFRLPNPSPIRVIASPLLLSTNELFTIEAEARPSSE